MGIRNLFNSVKRILSTPVTFRRPAMATPNPTKAAIERAQVKTDEKRKRARRARSTSLSVVPVAPHRQSRTWSRKLDANAVKRAELREYGHVEPLRIRLLTDPAYLRRVTRSNGAFPVTA